MYFKPADSAELKDAVDTALANWQSRHELKHPTPAPACKPSMPLWDSMTKALADLGQQPGRRVLLVVTDGQDNSSRSTWTKVMNRAQTESVAASALTNILQVDQSGGHEALTPVGQAEDKLNQICEFSVEWRSREN
jgi:hypothetical protein